MAANGFDPDREPDGHALTGVRFEGAAANVGALVNRAGRGAVRSRANRAFRIKPDGDFNVHKPGQSAPTGFDDKVRDSGGLTDIAHAAGVISVPHRAPPALNDLIAFRTGGTASGRLRVDDSDPDGCGLWVVGIRDDPAAMSGAHDLSADWGDAGRVELRADGTFWFVNGDGHQSVASPTQAGPKS